MYKKYYNWSPQADFYYYECNSTDERLLTATIIGLEFLDSGPTLNTRAGIGIRKVVLTEKRTLKF